MATLAEQIQAAITTIQTQVARFVADAGRVGGIVNGPATGIGSTVTLDGGATVPTVAKLQADIRAGVPVRTGAGVPANSLGVDGDIYVDTVTLRLHRKSGGTYDSGVVMRGTVFVWRGEWSGATAYLADQAVSRGGASYIAIAPNSGVEPGVTAGWATSWSVLAAKGADGVGTGNVTGPASSVDGDLVVFDGTTGRILKSGGTRAAILGTATGLAIVFGS